jgi:hypothetical protein
MFPLEVYSEPRVPAPLTEALVEASTIINHWLEHGLYEGTEEMAAKVVLGWASVYLTERIAAALLAARGYDLDALCDLLDARQVTGKSVGDCFAEWETAKEARP